MDEDSLDEKPLGSLFSRQRSPCFNKEEVKTLINLVEKYKNIVLNKSTNHAAKHAKEIAWTNITKAFNSQGFKNSRSIDNLKTKWENLKKDVRKISKNLLDVDNDDIDEINSHIVSMFNAVDNSNEISLTRDFDEELKGLEVDEPKNLSNITDSEKYWNENSDKDTTADGEDIRKRINRSMNFTPQECNILLRCVRTEKKYIFNKESTGKALKLKNQAWNRITHCFNQICPKKRTKRVLRTKFTNMKMLAKRETKSFYEKNGINKYSKPEDSVNNVMKIKTEPAYDDNAGSEVDDEDVDDRDGDVDDDNGSSSGHFDGLHSNDSNHVPDPLSTVMNSDSGLGFMNTDACNSDDKEVVRLKTELLQYQLETAKLERKRIEDAIRVEVEANHARATETALRLRAARLEAVSAAMKLAPGHPALLFTAEETLAQHYLSRYRQSLGSKDLPEP